jgi:hypothetical protein
MSNPGMKHVSVMGTAHARTDSTDKDIEVANRVFVEMLTQLHTETNRKIHGIAEKIYQLSTLNQRSIIVD